LWVWPFPSGRVFTQRFCSFFRVGIDAEKAGACMDKAQKEILQAAKELTAKFIETRTISPSSFAEIFPMIYRVVSNAVPHNKADEEKHKGKA
jgi:hypothetical protein